jgi:uncharacterized protein YybS (DUF2232 family)
MGVNTKDLAAAKDDFYKILALVKFIIPSILVLSSIAASLITVSAIHAVFQELGHRIEPLLPFGEWVVPAYLTIGFLSGIILSMPAMANKYTFLRYLGSNLWFFFSILYSIQGLSIIWWYADKYKLSKGPRYLLILIAYMFQQVLLWLGLLDAVFDFRGIKRTLKIDIRQSTLDESPVNDIDDVNTGDHVEETDDSDRSSE